MKTARAEYFITNGEENPEEVQKYSGKFVRYGKMTRSMVTDQPFTSFASAEKSRRKFWGKNYFVAVFVKGQPVKVDGMYSDENTASETEWKEMQAEKKRKNAELKAQADAEYARECAEAQARMDARKFEEAK